MLRFGCPCSLCGGGGSRVRSGSRLFHVRDKLAKPSLLGYTRVMTKSESPQVAIYATSVQTANGELTADVRHILVARADRVRSILAAAGDVAGSTAKTNISIPILDSYTHAEIGRMAYSL